MNDVPNSRCWEIINILLNEVEPITINNIAKKLDVSNKTIRNDLKHIEEYFECGKYGKLIKKPRVGVWLEANQEERILLREAISKSKVYIQPYSSEERQLYITKRLLLSNESITMQLLADELYVSRVTIYKDLEEVEKWLEKYNLKLLRKQNYGIEVVGDEKNWRKAAADLLVLLKNDEEIKNILQNQDNFEKVDSRISREDYEYIKKVFSDIDIRKIEDILSEAEKKMEFLLTDEAFAGLIAHIAIGIKRIKQNKDIDMESKQLSVIKEKKEYEIAAWIAKKIEKEFDIEVPEPEVGYISLHVLGAKIKENFHSNEVNDVLKNVDSNILELAKEIVELIGNILSVDFTKDKKLLAGLALHLRPAINRLKYGLSLRNPLLDDIKNNYPSVFGAAWATSVLFEKFFGVKVTEEEIGYLSIHIGAALERLNKKTRAIVVCSSGIGTAQLVAVRLEKEIHGLEIVDITSVHEVDKINPKDFDIVITTIPFKYTSKPTVQISVFVNANDIERVKKYIKNVENTRKFDKEIIESKENSLFNQELIFSKMNASSREEVINRLGDELVNKGFVEKGYIETVLDREKVTSTAVGKGVAIPHGNEKLVHRPSIAIATLNEPIDWSGEKVDIVFLLALGFEASNEIRKFFKSFYSMLDNVDILNTIRDSKTSEQIYEVLLERKS
ncbi:BglG family transcription antiterminator [Caldisalinibacter kiritimatiensis]|uniref:Transcriptional antiterminator of lichenan operon, BglG family n=1 Tax=Caldisalinibacter kiritimatiensis TaxID=1304284 RepID=R1ASL2_9FIRM|nr:BglG family transcription antiterminator [Caldisalinibacter kiritimatiensis]EOC99656.1 Transcriptional antiterminator of lichenan operon, BglG family [Caldisalinibacter kiritimatiensis]